MATGKSCSLCEIRFDGHALGGKLYMMTFEAPVIFYYDRDLPAYRAMADNARIAAVAKK
jgi:hypothetical protein